MEVEPGGGFGFSRDKRKYELWWGHNLALPFFETALLEISRVLRGIARQDSNVYIRTRRIFKILKSPELFPSTLPFLSAHHGADF